MEVRCIRSVSYSDGFQRNDKDHLVIFEAFDSILLPLDELSTNLFDAAIVGVFDEFPIESAPICSTSIQLLFQLLQTKYQS